MPTELETKIYLAIQQVGEEGTADITIQEHEISLALGKVRNLGYSAALNYNQETGHTINITFRKVPGRAVGRPTSEKLNRGLALLDGEDPVLFPSERPKADSQYFQYHDIFTKIHDKQLFISKNPFESSTKADAIPASYSGLVDCIEEERECITVFSSNKDAKEALTYIKLNYGKPALVRLRQEGVTIKLAYIKELPLLLAADYPSQTVLEWATELALTHGSQSACIYYNRHESSFGREKVSIAQFERLIGGE